MRKFLRQLAALSVLAFASTAVLRAQCPDPKPLELRLNLAGACDPAASEPLMSDSLRVHGVVPLTEPYAALGYTHRGGGGGELMHASLLNITGPHAIVDWVVVEVRHPNDPGKRIATKSALLKRNGEVIAANGQPLSFCVDAGRYQVAVRHRNHLGVITNRSVLLDGNPVLVDFSNAEAPNNTRGGTDALQPLNADSTLWGLWPGDVSFDGTVRYVGQDNDRDPILVNIGGNVPTEVTHDQYTNPDVNLDSRVQYVGQGNDRDPVLVAIGGNVPTDEREDYIPDDSLVFKPNVHFVDSTEWVLDYGQSELDSGNVMVFDIQGPMPTIAAGHTLVVYAAGGWIRVVSNVTLDGNTVTIESVPGNFLDIVESGEMQYELQVNSDAASASFGPLSITLPSGFGIQGGLIDFSNSLNFGFLERARINSTGFVDVWRGVEGSIAAQGRLALQGALNGPPVETPPLFLGAVALPGPFGIPILAHFTAQVSLEGSFAGAAGYDALFNMNGTVSGGVKHGESGNEHFFHMHASSPSIVVQDSGPANVNIGADLDGILKATLLIGGVPVGGYLEIGPSLRLETAWSAEGHHVALTTTGKLTLGVGLTNGDEEWAIEGSWSTPPVVEWKAPGRVEYVSGSDQVGTLETVLPAPIIARSLSTLVAGGTELANWPSAGNLVKFEPCATCGTVAPAEEPTQADGTAQRNWTLGQGQPGVSTQSMVVSLKDGNGNHVDGSPFSVVAEASPLRLELVGGNNQQGLPNMDLPGGLEFRVVGSLSPFAPVPNITVDFDVVSGGGEMITPEVVTDATGSGYGLWTLGSYADGEQEVVAYLLDAEGNHVEGSPIHFTATFRPLRVLEVTSTNCVTDPGTACEEKTLQLVSDFGNIQFNFDHPIAGIPVNFEVFGGGQVGAATAISDANGYVTLNWTLGTNCLDHQRVEATPEVPGSIEVVPPHVEFNGYFGLVDLAFPEFSGNEQAGVSFQPLSQPLRVKVTDQNGDPVHDNVVAFVVNSGGGSVTATDATDAQGIAEATWVLGDHAEPQEVIASNLDDCNYSVGAPLLFTADVPCPLTVTDIDGNEYDVVNLGGKCWTKQNLRVTHYNNGVPLRDTLTLEQWGMEWNTDWFISGGFNHPPIAYFPNPLGSYAGHLYMGYQPGLLCPAGWRVPRASEWSALMTFAAYAGLGWTDPDGFNAGPYGTIHADIGSWDPALIGTTPIPDGALFWTSSRVDPDFITPYFRYASISTSAPGSGVIGINPSINGYACRCIRGAESNSMFEP
jgi:uncharacterized protein (TIGR02145 family)